MKELFSDGKKKKRPIVNFFDKYFTDKELEEFIDTNKITSLERLKELEEIEKKYNELIKVFKQQMIEK